jgi:hypothetical protein
MKVSLPGIWPGFLVMAAIVAGGSQGCTHAAPPPADQTIGPAPATAAWIDRQSSHGLVVTNYSGEAR